MKRQVRKSQAAERVADQEQIRRIKWNVIQRRQSCRRQQKTVTEVKRVKAVVVPTAEVVSRSLVEKSRRSMKYVQVECDGIGTVE